MIELRLLSALEKVFPAEAPQAAALERLSMLRADRLNLQAAFRCDADGTAQLSLDGIDPAQAGIYAVRTVPVGLACFDNADDYYIRKTAGAYPDLLIPGKTAAVAGGAWHAFWIELSPAAAGTLDLTVTLTCGGESAQAALTVTVIDAALQPQTLIHTNWFHADGICNYYGVAAMSEPFWRICEAQLRMAAAHGVNCILTPLFTPPLDTAVGHERTTVQLVRVRKRGGRYLFDFRNLKRWIALCEACGIRYFEMSHFFTQWGALHAPKIVVEDAKGRRKQPFGWQTPPDSRAYAEFLRQFAGALTAFLQAAGVAERCFFHISDEPSEAHLATYKKRAALMRTLFPGFRILDALSDLSFYQLGAVDVPVPCENAVEAFRGAVPALWTYYCCVQGTGCLPNRFIAMPSLRNRILGCLLYKYQCEGFLQWGYNFYNSQYSLRSIDPFRVTDAGGAFPAGDSFVIYPGTGGEPLPSLRLKVFADGLRDLRALQTLEALIGRPTVLALLEDGIPPLTFTEYPHDPQWLLGLRARVNQKIKESYHEHSI